MPVLYNNTCNTGCPGCGVPVLKAPERLLYQSKQSWECGTWLCRLVVLAQRSLRLLSAKHMLAHVHAMVTLSLQQHATTMSLQCDIQICGGTLNILVPTM